MIKQQPKSCAYCAKDAFKKDDDGKYACSVCLHDAGQTWYQTKYQKKTGGISPTLGQKRENYNDGAPRKPRAYRKVRGFIQADSLRPKIAITFEIADFNAVSEIAEKENVAFAEIVRRAVKFYLGKKQ